MRRKNGELNEGKLIKRQRNGFGLPPGMRLILKPAILALFSVAGCVVNVAPPPSPVWHDEFDGPAGASFDRVKWVADTGGHGFGNKERQFYTTRGENVALDGNGHLVITARAEPSPTRDRRAGRIADRLRLGPW